MKKVLFSLLLFLIANASFAQSNVKVEQTEDGWYLLVDGKPFMVNGMNWDYVPIGTTITDPGIWAQSDDIIKTALDAEMSLLRNMGVNTIRTYGIAPKWIEYIYENHGIYTMLNTTFGAYGLTIDGVWTPETNYADKRTREILMQEHIEMAQAYKNTPGLLLYMLGNENNYHLSWSGAETEDIPIDDKDAGIQVAARNLYKTFNDVAKEVKAIDPTHPVAICNGDLVYSDLVREECTDIDIYGSNVYRGKTFTDLFDRARNELGLPVLLTEFGADAFNARDNQEDQYSQAYYDLGNWQDIYENAAGLGRAENAIGGFTFQFSDGWWKYKQTENLDLHDNTASWSNGGYSRDQAKEGDNNMNEEWFGICAKGPTNENGLYTLYPRAAYYALKEAHLLNPYAEGMSRATVDSYFNGIQVMDAVLKARGDKAIVSGAAGSKVRISSLRAEFETFNTGGSLISTPDTADPTSDLFPNELGFDHMQSYYVGVEGRPSPSMRAEVNFNLLGNVAENPIDQIFYESFARPVRVEGPDGEVVLRDNERLRVYNAEYEWNNDVADVRGFYRTGHYHWGYEGDFFGLYPEANYGPNLDIYNGEIIGMEIDAKGKLDGLKAAFGPQLWWGANPAVLAKYHRKIKNFDVTGIYHKDVDDAGAAVTSIAVPLPQTERATLSVEREFGKFGLQVGGIWGGKPLNGREFQVFENGITYVDQVNSDDNWGGKAKLTYQGGKFNWYALAASTGLVANGGFDQTLTYTGWRLKDNGSGNQNSFLSGFTYQAGKLQIAPNFLYQKPLVDAIPNDAGGVARLRNVQDDPFAVRANRETVAGEILFTFDPTPASYYYQWDNDRAEDAPFAMNLGFVYWHLPTTMDAAIGFFENSRVGAPFGNSVPAEDLWEVNSRIVSKVNSDFGLVANLYTGRGQSNGSDARIINRSGGDVRMLYKKFKMQNMVKVNDWGPYDYHRDFNLTYPIQLMTDISTSLGKPDWFILPGTQLGVRGTWRSLDEFSPRYSPTQVPPNAFPPVPPLSPVGFDDGTEWEIRTYLHINIGK